MSWIASAQGPHGVAAVMVAAVLTLGLAAAVRLLRRRATESHKRGVRVLDVAAQNRRKPRRRRASPEVPALAGVAVPFPDETKHFKLIGTTGTGKSTAIRRLLAAALARGDRALIADPDGGYRARFFDRRRGDVVLNPFEAQSVKWDPLAEVRQPYDAEQLATGLIASSDDASGNEWRAYARTFLGALIRRCRGAGRCDTAELWRLLSLANPDELRPLLANTPAQPFLDPDNARMFASLRSVAVSAMAALEHVQSQRAAPFCVRDWVRAGGATHSLFLPYKAGQIAALRAMIATWVRIAIFEAMDGAEDRDQRLWFVVDELDALGAIEGLKDALARLRKFGGRCVLGFQSIAQVSGTYGTSDAQTIVENCGNTLILRCSGGDDGGTARFASRLIGEREIVRRQTSRSSDRDVGLSGRIARRSRNVSDQHVTEPAVLPSELEQLPDLSGYVRTASSRAWLRVSF